MPQVSFVEFMSGTNGSGHNRAPVTGALTSTVAANAFPCAQMSTGSDTSWVDPSLKPSRRVTGKTIDVLRRK